MQILRLVLLLLLLSVAALTQAEVGETPPQDTTASGEVVSTSTPSAPVFKVWFAPITTRVTPDSPAIPASAIWNYGSGVKLRGVRGERVPLQVIISSPRNAIDELRDSSLWVAVSELRSERGIIPQTNIKTYLEYPLLVYGSSRPGAERGFYYDALVPLTKPFNLYGPWGTTLPSRPLWIEINVPRFSAPGIYTGTVAVVKDGSRISQTPLALKIDPITLPEKPSIKTFLGLFESWFYPHVGLERDSDEVADLLRSYYDFFYERRLNLWFNELLSPRVTKYDNDSVSVVFNDSMMEEYLGGRGVTDVVLSAVPYKLAQPGPAVEEPSTELKRAVASYLKQVYDYFNEHGWRDRLIFNSPIDEPNTKRQYEGSRVWAKLVKEHAPGIRFLVTESPRSENNEWGTLRGDVTHFSANGNELARNDIWQIIKAEQKRGTEVSWYTSCDQVYPQPNVFIDGPHLDPLLIPWATVRFGLQGFLYWGINYWIETGSPWEQPVTFIKGMLCSDGGVLNGEGSLIYPGNQVNRFTGQQDVVGPVSSIRLELLREGLEDADLLLELPKRGKSDELDRLTRQLVPTIRTMKRDEGSLLDARNRLLDLLAE